MPYTDSKSMASTKVAPVSYDRRLYLARVLLVDDDPTARLTLQTVLKAGGYHVDSAASAAEAVHLLEEQEYELVLSDLQMESGEAGLQLLAYARALHYRPATAVVHTWQDSRLDTSRHSRKVLTRTEDVPELLGKVADLISERATRRLAREMRQNGN